MTLIDDFYSLPKEFEPGSMEPEEVAPGTALTLKVVEDVVLNGKKFEGFSFSELPLLHVERLVEVIHQEAKASLNNNWRVECVARRILLGALIRTKNSSEIQGYLRPAYEKFCNLYRT